MFTGIIQGVASISALHDRRGLRTFMLEFPPEFARGLDIGASVSVDGVCLTVTARPRPDAAEFDVMLQSLNVTTLAGYEVGTRVNVERAAKDGAEIGGHPLSGHIDFAAELAEVHASENNCVLRIQVPPEFRKYFFAKGYVAVNGASLTIANVNRAAGWFEAWLIPETLRMTVFSAKQPGDRLNIEIERGTQVLVDTVRASMEEKLGALMPTLEAVLAAHGSNIDELAGPLSLPKQQK